MHWSNKLSAFLKRKNIGGLGELYLKYVNEDRFDEMHKNSVNFFKISHFKKMTHLLMKYPG